jgi:hypothetical protein
MATITCKAYSGKTELPNTPIKSVTPSSDWPGSGDTVSNSGSVSVVIKPVDTYPGYGVFTHWEIMKGSGTAPKRILTVPADEPCHARAHFKIPEPDPCQGDRDAYNNYNPDPGTPPNVVHAERLRHWGILNACEVTNGESLTPKPGP